MHLLAPPSPILDAAIAILSDGKARTADEILAEGLKRSLFDRSQTRKHLYTALSQYVQRTLGRGRKPTITEGADRRFRLNQPIDDWPDLDTTGLAPLVVPRDPPAAARLVLAELSRTASGSDPIALETAVCAAFEVFGFLSTHVGGNGAPDGYADALLGSLSYRVMIECKLGRGDNVSRTDAVAEAAKYVNPYRAQYAVLVAPSFDGEITFASELHAHGVAAWSVDDLIRAATLGLDAYHLRDLFAAGYAADGLDDLAWRLVHGAAKRLRVIASMLIESGRAQQRVAHSLGSASQSPRLSVDVGMAMIDAKLAAIGGSGGATRQEVETAFAWLTSPYVCKAVWTDESHSDIVILA